MGHPGAPGERIGATTGLWEPDVEVEAHRLSVPGGIAVTVWTYGATIVEVLVPDRNGVRENVVVRLPTLADYEARDRNPYIGATLGRFCRTVAGGRFTLDGTVHQLVCNDGANHIHGGSVGFDRRVWETVVADPEQLVLRLVSADGDQGYPGRVVAEASYRLTGLHAFEVELSAQTDAPTIVGMTNHVFWNLAGAGTIERQLLAINAGRVVALDDEFLPESGPPIPVGATRLDRREPRAIAADALDDFFVLDDPAWAAELRDPGSGRMLRVVTDQMGMGVYSGDGLPDRRAGICLQPGAWPDAPNRPDFPPATLEPGAHHRHRTSFEFEVGS